MRRLVAVLLVLGALVFAGCSKKSVFSVAIGGDEVDAFEFAKRSGYNFASSVFRDRIKREIKRRSPIIGGGKESRIRLELVKFDYKLSSAEVLEDFELRGLERPTVEHALKFGRQYPEEQRKRSIVFLHKPWRYSGGSPCVLVLIGGADGRRSLSLDRFDGRWDSHYAFAGVRLRK